MRTRIALVNCYICGQQDYGPEGFGVCTPCIAEASHCTKVHRPRCDDHAVHRLQLHAGHRARRGLSDATRRVMPMPLSPLGYHSCVVSGDFAGRR